MPPIRVFSARETGVKTMAWSAAQDRDGILHFGCDTLMSFDGDRWRPEAMSATYAIRGLDVGPNGRIWAAGVNEIGWFEKGAEGRLQYHSLMARLPPGTSDLGDVWRAYAEGASGALFVAREKVLRWDGHAFETWSYPGMHLLWSFRTSKAVYVHYPPLGLLSFARGAPTLAVPASVVGSAYIRWLDDSGRDWTLLTSEGFKILHDGSCTPVETDGSAFARANIPTSVVALGDGSIAVGTLQGGIAIIERSGRIRRVFNQRSGLPSNQIYSIYLDRDGGLWAMGPSHIVRLAIGSGVAAFGPQNGYPSGGCESVAELAGTTYVASHSDFLRLDADPDSGGAGRFASLGIASSRFYSLLSLPQGLAIAHFHGLGLWTPAGMQPLIPSTDVVFRTSPSQSRPGMLLVSQLNSVLLVDPRTGQSTVVADALPDYADSLADEPSGRLWIGTLSRGLLVAEPGSARALPASPRFGSLPVSGPVLVSRAGSAIVAISKGAAHYLGPGAGRFIIVPGFPDGTPSALSNSDRSGSIWAAVDPDEGGHSPRLGRISFSVSGAAWTPQPIEGLPDIGSLLGLHVAESKEGEFLWLAGSDSILRADAGALAPRPPHRQPLVRAWTKGNAVPSELESGCVLPYATSGIHVEYSSLDYGMRESMRFQTMLGGVETEWSAAGDSAGSEISGLREGSYELRVRMVSDSGAAGAPAVFRFRIDPPGWRTPSAYAGYGLAGTLAVLALLRLRVNALRRRALALEEMVRQRTLQLEKANAAKTDFVASMSHEIRNPMGGILGTALELSGTRLEARQRELVDTLQNCASFLASLVEDALDFAAIEAGAYKVNRSPFRVRQVLEAVVTMLRPGAAGVAMRVVVDPALPECLLGDGARVQQVIVNFATNSIKFGGKTIDLSARHDGKQVVFAVTDDGPGIPADEQRNLFIRFSRLKSARNSAIPGTGLGLAVSRALAERMGGSVGAVSSPGGGSTFFLRLPLESAEFATEEPPECDMRGARALVVEDIEYNARSLGLMLGKVGYAVDFAPDGEAAIKRLGATDYQALFLDCDLPKLGGVEVARRLRASEAGRHRTYIVATTAHSTVEDQNACAAAGMDAFVAKPITPEKLRAALTASRGHGLRGASAPAFGPAESAEPALQLTLLRHLADGKPGGLGQEVANFVASLDEAMHGVARARAQGSRAAISSAAHRVISHARMVGAAALAATAEDLQDFAPAYTEAELSEEIAMLGERAAALRETLECIPKEDGSGG